MNKIINYIKRITISRKLQCGYVIYFQDNFEITGPKYIHIGKRFCANEDVKIEAWNRYGKQKFKPEIIIGDDVFINSRTHLSATQKMVIGNGVLFGSDVFVCDNNHGRTDSRDELMIRPNQRDLYSKGPISIGDRAWIGDKVVILGGVSIGEGAVVGASSVVTKDIPAYSIAVGNPARVIRQL